MPIPGPTLKDTVHTTANMVSSIIHSLDNLFINDLIMVVWKKTVD